MSIKVKSTAVAIATVSTVLSYSVPSQAGEYKYLYELDKLAKQQDVKSYIDKLSASDKLKQGKRYCTILEQGSMKDVYSVHQNIAQYSLQEGYSDQIIGGEIAIFYASIKELCPEYIYKFNNFMGSEEKEI